MKWLIIADDLTGAADCAIAFAKRGLESVVDIAGTGKADERSMLEAMRQAIELAPKERP